jgi:hypothetical protein
MALRNLMRYLINDLYYDRKARKWQRSVVRLGQISIPKWVPDRSVSIFYY